MMTLVRTFMTVTPADIVVVETILKLNGVSYLKEWSVNDGAWWVLFMERSLDVTRAINEALGIRGTVDGRPA